LCAVPGGGAVRAEEILAHVVIDADDVEAALVKKRVASLPMRPAEPVIRTMLNGQISSK